MLLDEFIVIWVIEHSIDDAIFIDKAGDFFLSKDQLNYFFEPVLNFWGYAVDIDKQIFIFEICSGEIEEKGAKCEVDIWFVGVIKIVDELSIIFNFPFIFEVFAHAFFIGV